MKTEYNVFQINTEMEEIFVKRTKLHRLLVRKNLLLMHGYLNLSLDLLKKRADTHDLSKFIEPERDAYIWMTWKYHCTNNGTNFDYPTDVATIVQQGWHHHIVSNLHHPEAHDSHNSMDSLDIVEMVCDWTAISQEQNINNGSCMPWAKINIDKKWNFSSSQKELIFTTIQELNKRNQAYSNK